MKNYLILLALFLSIEVFSQSNLSEFPSYWSNTQAEGYIIMADGTKKEGFIMVSEPQFMIQDVSYKKSKTAVQFFNYRPNELRAFYANNTLWVPVNLNGTYKFAILKRDGGIREYVDFFKNESSEQEIDQQSWYWKASNQKFTNGAKFVMGFKTKMADYVKDYKSLSKKIADKEKGYRMFGMEKILDEYNTWYAENNPGFVTVQKELEAMIIIPEVITAPSTNVPSNLVGKWDDGENRILTITSNRFTIHYNDEYGGKWAGTIVGVNTEKGVLWSDIDEINGSKLEEAMIANYSDKILALYYRNIGGTLKLLEKSTIPLDKVYDLPTDSWFGRSFKKIP